LEVEILIGKLSEELKSMLGSTHDSPKADYAFGVINAVTRRFQQAERAYKEAIRLRPDYWAAHYSLGVLYADNGRLADAARELELAVERLPASVRVYRKLGRVYHDQGDFGRAIGSYRSALEKMANDPQAYLLHQDLGLVYYTWKKYDEAISEFWEASSCAPYDPYLRVNLGTAYLAGGRLEEAAEEFRSALRIKPDLLSALRNLGTLYLKAKSIDEGIEVLERAVAPDRSHANTHRKLALGYGEKHLAEKAQEHMRKAMEIEELERGGAK
jgi:tetratricopeptide (TPR) repeat protein